MVMWNPATPRATWEHSSWGLRWEQSCAAAPATIIRPTFMADITIPTPPPTATTPTTPTPAHMATEARPTAPMAAHTGELHTIPTLGPMLAALRRQPPTAHAA